MGLRYKHRLIVEITLNEPVTEKMAVLALEEYHRRLDLEAQPALRPYADTHIYADNLRVKQLSKVLPYLMKWKGQTHEATNEKR